MCRAGEGHAIWKRENNRERGIHRATRERIGRSQQKGPAYGSGAIVVSRFMMRIVCGPTLESSSRPWSDAYVQRSLESPAVIVNILAWTIVAPFSAAVSLYTARAPLEPDVRDQPRA